MGILEAVGQELDAIIAETKAAGRIDNEAGYRQAAALLDRIAVLRRVFHREITKPTHDTLRQRRKSWEVRSHRPKAKPRTWRDLPPAAQRALADDVRVMNKQLKEATS